MEQQETHSEQPVIKIKGVYKSFGDLHILRDINLEVMKGENMVILGRSGTGKSFLIKILAGLLLPDKGHVEVLGQNVDQLAGKELDALRLRIGFSFQNSALYESMSVRKNLEFPLKMNRKHLKQNEVSEAVEEVLNAVGLIDKLNQMPGDLSGGQRKRIGIARTLILKPEIMLYDEPTSGLDPITSEEINQLIIDVREKYNTTSIIITHDLTCAKTTGDRVAMLLDGRFAQVGTFEEVFKSNNEQIKQFYEYNFIQS